VTLQQGLVFALKVYGVAAVVAMATAALLHLTYIVVRKTSGD
jgi:hypothetical protein